MSHFTLPRFLAPKRSTTRRARRTRGQSLVEFALVLPIMLFLTLIALDFGRIYLGYINLQNMARIAANVAANNPDAWGATPNAATQARFKAQILADATATNCILPKVGGVTQVPTPTFTDTNGNGLKDVGESVKIEISCAFGVITPGISAIVGDTVTVSAASTFPIKSGMTAIGPGGGGGPGIPPNAAFTGNGVVTPVGGVPASITGLSPFVVEFRDTSGGVPTAWDWTFPGGTDVSTGAALVSSTAQDPLFVKFVTLGPHVVTLKASNLNGFTTTSMTITITSATNVNFTSNPPAPVSGTVGLSVAFTDTSSTGGTAWAWTFGDGGTASTQNPTHVYNTVGTFNVTLTVTYPAPDGIKSVTKTGYVSIVSGMCTVPSLIDVNFDAALAVWQGTGHFTGIVTKAPGSPSGGNWKIKGQTLTGSSLAPCNSSVEVSH